MLGVAWQHGWVPLSLGGDRPRDRAERRRGRLQPARFQWGRRAAHDLRGGRGSARRAAGDRWSASCRARADARARSSRRRVEFLTAYQDAAYAAALPALVERVRGGRAAGRRCGDAAVAGGRALPLQAAGGQGRVGGGAAVRRPSSAQELERDLRGRLQAALPPRRLAVRPRPTRPPAPVKREVGPWVLTAPSGGWRAQCGSCAASWLDPFRNSPSAGSSGELLARLRGRRRPPAGRRRMRATLGRGEARVAARDDPRLRARAQAQPAAAAIQRDALRFRAQGI